MKGNIQQTLESYIALLACTILDDVTKIGVPVYVVYTYIRAIYRYITDYIYIFAICDNLVIIVIR